MKHSVCVPKRRTSLCDLNMWLQSPEFVWDTADAKRSRVTGNSLRRTFDAANIALQIAGAMIDVAGSPAPDG